MKLFLEWSAPTISGATLSVADLIGANLSAATLKASSDCNHRGRIEE
jgi:uncharacterized protein YjbI with pentapeptide repeats